MDVGVQVKGSMKSESVARFVAGFSIEVMPRTAAKIPDFKEILPAGTQVYIANIEGTPFDDMLNTARRISGEGFRVIPHITARSIRNKAELENIIKRYRQDVGITEALVLAGGMTQPYGDYSSALQLLDTGIFECSGFTRIVFAGHPEGNSDIDRKGGHAEVDRALLQKQRFAEDSGVEVELATQFVFEADAVIAWSRRIAELGISLPINVGIAGPARLQTLLKYALECGVGPSIRVIQRRAGDVTKLLLPFKPDDVVLELAEFTRNNAESRISGIHIFPLGGIKAAANWAAEHT